MLMTPEEVVVSDCFVHDLVCTSSTSIVFTQCYDKFLSSDLRTAK